MKTDTAGALLWQKEYGWSVNDFPSDCQYTRNGNIIIAGSTTLAPSYQLQLKMLLVNQQGDSLRSLAYSPTPSLFVQNSQNNNDRVLSLRDGGYLAIAAVDSAGAADLMPLLVKVNGQLQPQWYYVHRPQRGSPRGALRYTGAVELLDSSLLVLATYVFPPANLPGGYHLLRFSKTGQLMTTTTLTCTLCPTMQGNKLLPDGDSALYVFGTCYGGPSGNRRAYGAHISLRGLPAIALATAPAPRAPAAPCGQLEALYPNPATGEVTLSYGCATGLAGTGMLQLHDVLGRTVRQTEVMARPEASMALSVAGLAPGLYFCTLQWPGRSPTTRKLLVRP